MSVEATLQKHTGTLLIVMSACQVWAGRMTAVLAEVGYIATLAKEDSDRETDRCQNDGVQSGV